MKYTAIFVTFFILTTPGIATPPNLNGDNCLITSENIRPQCGCNDSDPKRITYNYDNYYENDYGCTNKRTYYLYDTGTRETTTYKISYCKECKEGFILNKEPVKLDNGFHRCNTCYDNEHNPKECEEQYARSHCECPTTADDKWVDGTNTACNEFLSEILPNRPDENILKTYECYMVWRDFDCSYHIEDARCVKGYYGKLYVNGGSHRLVKNESTQCTKCPQLQNVTEYNETDQKCNKDKKAETTSDAAYHGDLKCENPDYNYSKENCYLPIGTYCDAKGAFKIDEDYTCTVIVPQQ